MMIAAIFGVCLKADRKRHYLKIAADLKPLLEKVTMSALPPIADINRCLRHLGFCARRRAYFTTSRHAKRELCPGYERSSRHNLCKGTVFLDPAL